MNKMTMLVACVFLAMGSTYAAAEEMVKYGGEGKLAVVNVAHVPALPLNAAMDKLGNILMIHTAVTNGTWTLSGAKKCLADSGATAAVFVVRDATLPMSLVALEEKWGMVNAEGLSEKAIEKETLRVAMMVIGAAASKFVPSAMRPAFSKEDLETKVGNVATVDSLMAISAYLPELGIKPYLLLTKKEAMDDGIIEK